VVLSIGDGDTIRDQQGSQRLTIRLAGIDAPEVAQNPPRPASREVLRMQVPTGWAATGRHSRLALIPGLPTLGMVMKA
jgi:micrococcal nuclease